MRRETAWLIPCCAKGGRGELGAAEGGSTLDSLIFACASASRMSDSSCLGVAEIVFLLVLILRICSMQQKSLAVESFGCAPTAESAWMAPSRNLQVGVCERTVCASTLCVRAHACTCGACARAAPVCARVLATRLWGTDRCKDGKAGKAKGRAGGRAVARLHVSKYQVLDSIVVDHWMHVLASVPAQPSRWVWG